MPERLLEVRSEFANYRRYFADFKAELQAADKVTERKKLQRLYQQLLETASGPQPEIASTQEMLNLAEKVVTLAAAPQLPTSYSAMLLAQPVEWIRRWWRNRPLAVLFRLDGKLPRLSEYRALIEKLGSPAQRTGSRTVRSTCRQCQASDDGLMSTGSVHRMQADEATSLEPRHCAHSPPRCDPYLPVSKTCLTPTSV